MNMNTPCLLRDLLTSNRQMTLLLSDAADQLRAHAAEIADLSSALTDAQARIAIAEARATKAESNREGLIAQVEEARELARRETDAITRVTEADMEASTVESEIEQALSVMAPASEEETGSNASHGVGIPDELLRASNGEQARLHLSESYAGAPEKQRQSLSAFLDEFASAERDRDNAYLQVYALTEGLGRAQAEITALEARLAAAIDAAAAAEARASIAESEQQGLTDRLAQLNAQLVEANERANQAATLTRVSEASVLPETQTASPDPLIAERLASCERELAGALDYAADASLRLQAANEEVARKQGELDVLSSEFDALKTEKAASAQNEHVIQKKLHDITSAFSALAASPSDPNTLSELERKLWELTPGMTQETLLKTDTSVGIWSDWRTYLISVLSLSLASIAFLFLYNKHIKIPTDKTPDQEPPHDEQQADQEDTQP